MKDDPQGGPLVAVIMPAFNAAATVAEAIDSVLRQTHSHLELVVVDDGSTDRTIARVREIKDPRLRLIAAPHAGPAAARNRGLSACRGEFVAFIDADDVWLSHKLEAQLRTLAEQPQAGAVYGLLDHIDSDGGNRAATSRQVAEGWILETLLVWYLIGNGSNLLVRRPLLEAVGGFDETLDAAEDWELSTRLAERCEIACVPTVVGLYRQGPGTLTSQTHRMERGFRQAHRKVFRRVPAPMRRKAELSLSVFYHYLAAKAWALGGRGIPSAVVYCVKSLLYAEWAMVRLGEPAFFPFADNRVIRGGGRPTFAALRTLLLNLEVRS